MQRVAYRPFNGALKGILFVGPVIILVVSIMNTETPAGWVVLGLAAAAIVVITFFSGVRIKASPMSVAIALVPFWGKKFRWSEVAAVTVEEVRPFEDFGGWGIKGSQKKHGLLLSAGDTSAVKFTLNDGRRYLVAVGASSADVVSRLESLARQEGAKVSFES